MAQTFTKIVVDGFQDGEFDFAAALQRNASKLADVDNLITALVAAEGSTTTDTFFAVTIVGHADRDDVPGLSAEERRAQELDASKQRAVSALNFVLNQLGFTPPATVDNLKTIGIDGAFAGEGDLVNLVPANEADRQQNRRVVFLVIQFSAQSQPLSFGEPDPDRGVA